MSAMLRRTAVALLAVAAAVSVTPTQARPFFHLALSRSEPMKDSTVAAPAALKLWFTEKPTLATSRVSLTGPDGKAIALGKLTMDTAAKAPIVAPVTGPMTPGVYTVKWTTASKDGHAVSGSFGFTVRAGK